MGQVAAGLAGAEDEIDDSIAVVSGGFAEDGFRATVPLAAVVGDLTGEAIDLVAGEGAGGFLDIVFRVVSFAEGEEFHQFAGEVFVGLALARVLGVQVKHHGRVANDGLGEGFERADRVVAEEFVLLDHEGGLADFLEGSGEVVVPEEHHFFAEGSIGGEHAAEPPALGFDAALAALALEGVIEFAAFAIGFFRGEVAGFPAQFDEFGGSFAGFGDGGFLVGPGGEGCGVERFGGEEEVIDCFFAAKLMEAADGFRAASEARSAEEVGGFEERPRLAGGGQHGGFLRDEG